MRLQVLESLEEKVEISPFSMNSSFPLKVVLVFWEKKVEVQF